ncbi:unnamed protein product [Acidocella sp. C78]|uniref:cell division protein FtsL n=1 Tax=Acidocella sp. C78 TaxID=1671486 RepID=UPI00191BC3B5|nr:hypothetical protein [Acidocella sp. C78]CAG4928568.1 unnamed protein product [Acidocella sp. C78]
MIRPVTLVTGLLMLGSGAWLFVVKHRAGTLDHQIGGVTAQIRSSEQRIRVLRAEWALETDPNRLTRLAAMFMSQLKPMKPDQLVSWQQLADALPPPGAEAPHLPLPPPLPGDVSGAPSSAPVAAVAAPRTVAAAAAPRTVALATIPPPPPVANRASSRARTVLAMVKSHTVARPVSAAHAPAHHAVVAVDRPARHQRNAASSSVVADARRPQMLGASVLAPRPADHSVAPAIRPIRASDPLPFPHSRRPPRSARAAAPAPHAASVFGGYAASLPPPRPADGGVP